MSLINANVDAINAEIRKGITAALSTYHKLPIGRIKVEFVNTTAEKTNPPGEHYNIQIGVQVVFVPQPDEVKPEPPDEHLS